MSTFDDLIVESPAVKREMRRLRDLHAVLELAVRQSVRERLGPIGDARMRGEVDRLVRDATYTIALSV